MAIFKVDICDFLRTGSFGPIRLGMTKKEAYHLLGKPQQWGGDFPWWTEERREQARPYDDCPIWKYDQMEFHFGDQGQQLFLIWCDYLDTLQSEGAVFSLDRWVFKADLPTREQMEQALTEAGIDYTRRELEDYGKLVLASGVEISYAYDTEVVNAIGHFDEAYIGGPGRVSAQPENL